LTLERTFMVRLRKMPAGRFQIKKGGRRTNRISIPAINRYCQRPVQQFEFGQGNFFQNVNVPPATSKVAAQAAANHFAESSAPPGKIPRRHSLFNFS
jgi:hypothetical protein